MRYCSNCLYPENHPLNILFDKEGVCSGCLTHHEKYSIDWAEKGAMFERLVAEYRNRPGTSYDCIIPVSGTGDDFYVVDLVKNKFKLNPLLTSYNTHFNTKVGVRNLARLITNLDCDHMMSTVGPETVKEITRTTFKKFGDIYWHVLAGTQTFPVQVATKLNIPLIIWGVNGWLDQVGMFSHNDNVEMTKKVRKEHALRGFDAESLVDVSANLSKKDLQAFTYPSDEQLEKSRVRGLYVGNYFFWDSQRQIDSAIEKFGYETCKQERTYNTYESIHCWNNAGVHDYIKFLKFGYGKVSDHVARDIRLGRISREEGLRLIKKYQAIKPSSMNLFLKWLDLEEDEFFSTLDRFRDLMAWTKSDTGEWQLISGLDESQLVEKNNIARHKEFNYREYKLTNLLEEECQEDGYILLGRSYMDGSNFKAIEG
ncbi:N-acetyl sugar amidotransferase [Aurantivibrio infirmus]